MVKKKFTFFHLQGFTLLKIAWSLAGLKWGKHDLKNEIKNTGSSSQTLLIESTWLTSSSAGVARVESGISDVAGQRRQATFCICNYGVVPTPPQYEAKIWQLLLNNTILNEN